MKNVFGVYSAILSEYLRREEPRDWVDYRWKYLDYQIYTIVCRFMIGRFCLILWNMNLLHIPQSKSLNKRKQYKRNQILLKHEISHYFADTESTCRTVIQWIIQTQYCYIFGAYLISKIVSTGWVEYLAGNNKILLSIVTKHNILENFFGR